MRVITGTYGGRILESPCSRWTRPTRGRVKESMFSMLEACMAQKQRTWSSCRILDAFAGSGSLGIEALSRGACHGTFLEVQPQVLAVLKKNLSWVSAETYDIFLKSFRHHKQGGYDLIFLDAPYDKGLVHQSVAHIDTENLLAAGGFVILEVSCHESATFPEAWMCMRDHRVQDHRLLLYYKPLSGG